MKLDLAASVAATALTAGVITSTLVAAVPAHASADMTVHQVFDATGSSFTCNGTVITADAGFLAYDYHVTTSGNGDVRDNGHGVPRSVTLKDAAGNAYRLGGAFSFTDTYDATTGATIAGTISDQLTVQRLDGQPVGRVGVVEHLYRDGTLRNVQFGNCADNND